MSDAEVINVLKERQRLKVIEERLKQLHDNKSSKAGLKFHKFQLAVFHAIFVEGKRRIHIRKGRKGGGTETVIYPPVRIAGCVDGASCYIIGPTQKLQSEVLWDNRRLHRAIPKAWKPDFNATEKRARLKINDSFIKVEGANDPEAARGWEGDVFVWDELKDQDPRSIEACYPNVMSRDAIWITLGSPPNKKTNHYYIHEETIKNDPDWALFHWTSWDNPFLPGGHEYLTKEKEKYYKQGRGDVWETEYEARYVFNTNQKVLPAFTSANKEPRATLLNMLARDRNRLKWVTIIDPGYATCFAALFGAYNPYTGQWYRLDEIYSTERNRNSVRDMWPLIRHKQDALHKGRWTNLYDSAALSFATEVRAYCRDYGYECKLTPTVKTSSRSSTDDEEQFFMLINGQFAQEGKSWVALECENYIREAEDYETDKNGNFPDKDNHLLDCDRYGHKYLGITDSVAQGEVIKYNPLKRPTSLEEDLAKAKEGIDMVGFGGSGANFDLMDVLKGDVWL